MPEPALRTRQREALSEVLRLVSARATAEADIERTRASRDAEADRDYHSARRTLAENLEAQKEGDRKADEEARRAVVDAAMAGEALAKGEFAQASRKIATDFDAVREKARKEHQRAKSEAAAAFESGEKQAVAAHNEARKPVDKASKVLESMRARLAAVFEDYRKFGLAEASATPSRDNAKGDDPVDQLFDRIAKMEAPLLLLEGLLFPRAMKGRRYLGIFIVLFLASVVPLVWAAGPTVGLVLTAGITIGGGLLLKSRLYALSRDHVSRLYHPLFQQAADAEALAARCRAGADERLKSQRTRLAERRDEALLLAKKAHAKAIAEGEATRDEALRRINEVYARRRVEIQTKQTIEMREAVEAQERRQAATASRSEAAMGKLEERYQALKEKIRDHHDTAWAEMAASWRNGMVRVRAQVEEIGREVDRLGPAWDDPSWEERPFPRVVPPVLRFGEARVELERLPGGISADPRLREGIPSGFTFPALRAFPALANLLVEAPAEGRAAAIAALQSAMFRLLTGLPPGQVRFTIVDPIGIGRNFGAFMHLADFDESLVTNQVWTEPRQIEERLAEISAHMEKVTQKYLRNEYATIEEYNARAGEVAEPYRVLVIADFPAGFDEKTAARLASIAAGGVSCGVLTLIAVDSARELPTGVRLDDLRAHAVNLTWKGDQLSWGDPVLGEYPLALDPPPSGERATRLVHRAGAAARDARRVSVPFEFIAPPEDAWWTRDSRAGIDVPLGKAGATKRQHLELGQGTAQHVLMAGRTGSGKSTLLHALIVNLALNYGPDQLELFLIDFKKGVEFKVYATHELPHASVVAIESEREFGISVLQRLDAEMGLRADRFREAGVQDVNGYRSLAGAPPLSRILLVVDEFQEFFAEEDKLAHEAAQLLDRLVRQGRAFGIHAFLGSQSLGGAFALARTTLGQMAVRIALQCSEADAQLILSEQNAAARLLSRPGEAIYNDANGLPEANHFFQVVWLPDDRREAYLKRLHDLALERPPALARTRIVFEGDTQADPSRNPLLKARLELAAWPPSPRSAQAWLGEAVAIKDPTSALFRRQGGNHLLIVGQNGEAALGIMASALLGLAAQYPPAESDSVRSGARFAVLDGSPEDEPRAEFLARVAAVLPHPVAVGGPRDAARTIAGLAEEVARRQQPDTDDGPEVFLFLHDLARFRDLRRRENDFGFSRRDEDAGPADHLVTILREGPALGIHVLAWCDTLNNLHRVFDQQMLRDFELRVLFQMSANDSAHLLDAPNASKLGPHRGLFASEEQNRLEKFRPYGLPSDDWLGWVRDQFRKRVAAVEG